jgi:hypothetical protein
MIIKYGEHCYGQFLTIDGEDVLVEDRDALLKNTHKLLELVDEYTLKEVLFQLAYSLPFDIIYKDDKDTGCEQCGNYNYEYHKEVNENIT